MMILLLLLRRWVRPLALALSLLVLAPSLSQAARLFTCGLEENSTTTTIWQNFVGTTPTVVTTTPHSGTYHAQTIATNGNSFLKGQFANVATTGTFFFSWYEQVNTTPNIDADILGVQSNAGLTSVTVTWLATGKIRLNNVVTSHTVDTASTFSTGTYYRFELSDVVSSTGTGTLELRIYAGDSTSPLEDILTNSGTPENTVSTNVHVIIVGKGGSTSTFLFDDVRINDSTGGSQNTWLGPGKIALMKPASDTTVTWSRGGTLAQPTNWQGISEVPGAPDDGTTLNCDTTTCTAAATTNEDKLGLSALPAEVGSNAVMNVIDVYARVNVATAVSGTMALVITDDLGTRTQGPTFTVNSVTWRILIYNEHQPLSLAGKTKANVNSFSVGYKALSGTVAKQVTAVWANVDYTDAGGGTTRLTTGVGN